MPVGCEPPGIVGKDHRFVLELKVMWNEEGVDVSRPLPKAVPPPDVYLIEFSFDLTFKAWPIGTLSMSCWR